MAEVKEKEKEDPNNAKTTIGEFLMPVSAGGAAAHNGAGSGAGGIGHQQGLHHHYGEWV